MLFITDGVSFCLFRIFLFRFFYPNFDIVLSLLKAVMHKLTFKMPARDSHYNNRRNKSKNITKHYLLKLLTIYFILQVFSTSNT